MQQTNLSPEQIEAGRKMWDYLHMNMSLSEEDGLPYADALVICGNNMSSLADRAAEIYHGGIVRFVVCSGGVARQEFDGMTEAEYFAQKLEVLGVPGAVILRENQATNTKENMAYSMELLQDKIIHPSRVILITAGQAERRVYATGKKHLGEVGEVLVTSPQDSYETFIQGKSEYTLSVLMGHIARLRAYAHKGDLEMQEIGSDALAAYHQLLRQGIVPNGYYDKEGALASLAQDLADCGEGLELILAQAEQAEALGEIAESKPAVRLR